MTKLTIAVAAPDNDENHLLVGESFIDPVFGSVKINFASVANGIILDGEDDISTTRAKLSIEKGGNRELMVRATDASGNTKTLPFTYQNETADDSGGTIHVWEGASIAEDDYFILNSGTKQHFMQMTRVNVHQSTTTDDVSFKDLFTGNTYSIDNKDFSLGQPITIGGQTYIVTNVSATAVTVASSDYAGQATGSDISVYPYIELVSAEDHRFAYTDDVKVLTDFNANATTNAATVTLHLPTGSINVAAADVTDTLTVGTANILVGADDSILVGSVYYNFAVTAGVAATANSTNLTVSMDITGITDGNAPYEAPGLLFVEDEDKSDSPTTEKNAVILRTNDTGTYSTVLVPLFTRLDAGLDSQSFDDSDFTGYIDSFGTYVLFDSSDTYQEFAYLTYPKTPMYAEVYIAESGAVVSEADLGAVLVTDAEVSTVQSRNLVVVGGSCINSVAAALVGGAYCTTAWQSATGVGAGQFLIQSYTSPYSGSKIALLVAGYNAEDTVNAATYVKNRPQPIDSAVGKKYIGTSATSAQLVVQ